MKNENVNLQQLVNQQFALIDKMQNYIMNSMNDRDFAINGSADTLKMLTESLTHFEILAQLASSASQNNNDDDDFTIEDLMQIAFLFDYHFHRINVKQDESNDRYGFCCGIGNDKSVNIRLNTNVIQVTNPVHTLAFLEQVPPIDWTEVDQTESIFDTLFDQLRVINR